MRKIALFGCTADPFTPAHSAIVKEVLCQFPDLERLIIIPTIVEYHRKGKKAWLTDEQRLQCISAFCNQMGDPRICIDTTEIDLRKKAENAEQIKERRFYHTLESQIKKASHEFPNEVIEFYMILGTDSYNNFTTWYNWQGILDFAKLIVVTGRDSQPCCQDIEPAHIAKFVSIPSCYESVSATSFRNVFSPMTDGFEKYLSFVGLTVTKSAELLHTPIFDVVKGPEVQPGFHPVQIKAPDWVMVIAEKHGRLCMVTQLRYGSMHNVREFVCGQVEPREDPRYAAVRELEEETGIKIDVNDLVLIGRTNPNPAMFSNHSWVYYVNLDYTPHTEVEQKPDEHEQLSVSWVAKSDVWKEYRDALDNPANCDLPAMYIAAVAFYDRYQLLNT